MSEQFTNDASTSLAAAIGTSDTSLTVLSGSQFPTSGNFRIRIDDEIMLVTNVVGLSWSVTRAAEACSGTQAAALHAAGTPIYGVLTAGALATISAGSGTVTSVAVVNATDISGSVASPSTTPTLTLTINSHAVTYDKMQQASTVTLLGNPTGGTANVQEITIGTGLAFSGGALVCTVTGGVTSFNTRTGAVTLTSSDVTTALGYTPGTVSSIDVSGGSTGLSASGGPVTGSGTITISGTLNPTHGGLGADTSGYMSGEIPIAQGDGTYAAAGRSGFFAGHGAPSGSLGYPSDYYIDLDSGAVYLKS